jgi:hypothetical protein
MIKFIEKKPKRENKAKILNPGFVVKKRALNQLDLQRAEWKGSAEERVRKRDESSRATYTEEGGRACRMQSGKNLPDLEPTVQKYGFLIGGLSPQFNPPREESHLCYEGNE